MVAICFSTCCCLQNVLFQLVELCFNQFLCQSCLLYVSLIGSHFQVNSLEPSQCQVADLLSTDNVECYAVGLSFDCYFKCFKLPSLP
jgi:hypothetical protein